jgi:hypothetical protein
MLKIFIAMSVFFSFNNLFASCVDHWIEEISIYYGTDQHYHLWDGYHDYRVEHMIHDLNTCTCLRDKITQH